MKLFLKKLRFIKQTEEYEREKKLRKFRKRIECYLVILCYGKLVANFEVQFYDVKIRRYLTYNPNLENAEEENGRAPHEGRSEEGQGCDGREAAAERLELQAPSRTLL